MLRHELIKNACILIIRLIQKCTYVHCLNKLHCSIDKSTLLWLKWVSKCLDHIRDMFFMMYDYDVLKTIHKYTCFLGFYVGFYVDAIILLRVEELSK